MREYELIELYCAVYHHYDNTLVMEVQRQTNNSCPKFTDVECLATYIWGINNQKFTVRGCYDFIKDYYGDWFPYMPSYQAYNHRICYLADAFKGLAHLLVGELGLDLSHCDFVNDSMPIVVAGNSRSGSATAAKGLCDKGYCASKKMYYHGIKLHIAAQCNYKAMPTPAMMQISKASVHDLDVAKEMFADIRDVRFFGDMAFIDKQWQQTMKTQNNVTILTPIKRKSGQATLSSADKFYSRAVSSVKQAIESLNNWLIEKTNIQRASKVRSEAGLLAFVWARVACACRCCCCCYYWNGRAWGVLPKINPSFQAPMRLKLFPCRTPHDNEVVSFRLFR